MKFKVMDEVYISSDTLNIGLPVGERGYVISLNPDIRQAENFCVRIPSKKRTAWVPECDLTASAEYLSRQADEVIRTSLVEFALERRDSTTFYEQVRK